MAIFALSDLHLPLGIDKPMDIFGLKWANYLDKIKEDWLKKVTEEDVVLISGDISWAMNLEDAIKEYEKRISKYTKLGILSYIGNCSLMFFIMETISGYGLNI